MAAMRSGSAPYAAKRRSGYRCSICQQVGQDSAVETGVGLVGEFEQLLTGVPARLEGGVDVEEVSGSARMNRADIVPATTSSMCRIGRELGEGLELPRDFDGVSVGAVGIYYGIPA